MYLNNNSKEKYDHLIIDKSVIHIKYITFQLLVLLKFTLNTQKLQAFHHLMIILFLAYC